MVQRIDRARLAISVFTLAEARVGFIVGDFGPTRIEREERRLRAFAQLPLDEEILAEWVQLKAAVRGLGLAMSDNDLWIAATASSYQYMGMRSDDFAPPQPPAFYAYTRPQGSAGRLS